MVFPGVLRGRPGPRLATILTSRPRRSLSSPRMCCTISLAVTATSRFWARRRKKTTRSRAARGTRSVRPESLPSWVARPHTSVASLFAARFRVWIQSSSALGGLQPLREQHPALSKEIDASLARHRRTPRESASPSGRAQSRTTIVRRRLSLLPQWSTWTAATFPCIRPAAAPARRRAPRAPPSHAASRSRTRSASRPPTARAARRTCASASAARSRPSSR